MKFNWKMNRDKWLILVAAGLILLIIAIPSGLGGGMKNQSGGVAGIGAAGGGAGSAPSVPSDDRSYEEQLERRVKQILKNVDGVGTVDVMIVLKTSEEKVLRVDKDTSSSSTEEVDSAGGTRKVTSQDLKENTILAGSGGTDPVVEKEIKPQIAGIVISAQGGGSPAVQSEISAAMEALFDIPAHKIKVLKRVE